MGDHQRSKTESFLNRVFISTDHEYTLHRIEHRVSFIRENFAAAAKFTVEKQS